MVLIDIKDIVPVIYNFSFNAYTIISLKPGNIYDNQCKYVFTMLKLVHVHVSFTLNLGLH